MNRDESGLLAGPGFDHDTLLILAVAYLLYKQDADKKLILALLFMLII